MRKSKNYYKFMEYMAFGISGWHEDAVMVDNGVIECVAYPKVAHIEDYSKLYKCNYDKMTMDSENTWLTIKCVLVNKEVIDVYYVTNECNLYIGQLILDDYRTQKQALDAIHKKVVCFFLNSREFCELHPTEDYNEYEEILDSKESTEHDRIKYLMDTHSLVPHVSINSHCMETVLYMEELLTQRYGNTIAHKCKMYNNGYYGCPADRQGNRCCGEKWCAETWKRYEAISNPNWHHVSLSTLSNLDFDMFDEKRQRYFTVYRELQETLTRLRKCKTVESYDNCYTSLMRRKNVMLARGEISNAMWHYIKAKLSMQNVESGVWASSCEDATGHHESRRYNKSRA
jgi:hypothetical protein